MAAFLTKDVDVASWLKLLTILRPPGPIRGPLATAALISAGEPPSTPAAAAFSSKWGTHKDSSFGSGVVQTDTSYSLSQLRKKAVAK